MDLKSALKSAIEAKKKRHNPEAALEKEIEIFKRNYTDIKNNKSSIDQQSYARIPKFYYKLPKKDEILAQKLREEARDIFLKKKSKELLDNNELQAFWALLIKYQSSNVSPNSSFSGEETISYKEYQQIVNKAGPKYKIYLTPAVFAKLLQTSSQCKGRISTTSLFTYVMRKSWLEQTWIGLSLYDVTGHGYLREADLESYITFLIPTLPQLDGLENSFHNFYVCTVVRTFFFFLDPLRTGRVRIKDVVTCSFLDDLTELREGELTNDMLKANWFSAPSTLHVYGQYLNLDRDHNGMLSKRELAEYGTGTLTSVFLDRVFQECLTYKGEMDYKTYLDFVLALENRHEPQSLHYLFKILDINGVGYLDSFSLRYFLREIQEQMRVHDQDQVSFEDIKDGLFDMIKPADPTKITLQDLLNSGQGEVFVSILIDLNGFWAYERRAASPETVDN
ncbi:serine/threonine-protein phosphatase 2A regulatory subunit B'' subunit gamma isoform X1 [Nilaparvata lugens]|uniref:serine/threonine-protein phosphatase 2A regulatory subunit B'' subunit gamma isoform X1 n=1 Tax=Nilaparvata lugens TaxID=108931 RepID=UPI00193DD656|nr:serine/threonine-protein phosphatase 2A regulatory subunit B'' subunit gamma isoform X1 [Nilaparvata lugens]XP_039288466.1 serine/threonine-protein phosphatase 2A regulatory subunit B'' subunit gamma isoform X1 [Nilaparvata lugens]